MIDLGPTELRLVREAERALMRQQLIDQWQVLPKLASALLDEWSAVAAARGLDDHAGSYWPAAERWLLQQVHRAA